MNLSSFNKKILKMQQWCLILMILAFFSVTIQGQEYEDNEFAEFEDFDEDEAKMDPVVVRGQGKKEEEREQPSEDDPPVDFPGDDEQEATVEDDDNDEYSHFNDEEEFVGYTNDFGKTSKQKSQSEPTLTFTKVPYPLGGNWESYYLEMILIAALILYFFNFMIGKNKNQKLANTWYNSHLSLLESNFALVGDDCKQEVENPGLIKESENIYTLWCSGRTNVEGMLIELKFNKRQDLISVFLQQTRPMSDKLVIKVHMEDMDSYVFALATKKTAVKLAKDMTDIATYCPERKPADKKNFDNLSVMSEIGEVMHAVLGDHKVISIMEKYSQLFDFFHFSDQYSGPKQNDDVQPTKLPDVAKTLIFGFNFAGVGDPSIESIEAMKPLLQLVFHLTDKLRKFKLSKEAKNKSLKNRARVEASFLKATHAARAEMAQTKREEKKREERERMLEIDDPDKQRKWEEREQRRNMKRRAPKMKQLKVG